MAVSDQDPNLLRFTLVQVAENSDELGLPRLKLEVFLLCHPIGSESQMEAFLPFGG